MRITGVFEIFWKLETGGSFDFWKIIKEPEPEQDSDF
jgi:hypothetical protein